MNNIKLDWMMNMISALIVDDDIATVEAIRDTMDWNSLGIREVFTAYNVSGAQKIISKENIDIIISDIEMPQASGLDLIKWVRKQNIDCEFLFLTCHESFSYATDAIHYNASAYLTKPFDMDIMKLNLQKIITKLMEKRNLQKSSEYGKWMEKNLRFVKLDFWKQLLEGNFQSETQIRKELKERHLEIEADQAYSITFIKLSNIEQDIEKYKKGVYEFVIENSISEIITGQDENDSVVKFSADNSLSYFAICKDTSKDILKEKCRKLIDTCKEQFFSIITCCISNPCRLVEFPLCRQKLEKLFYYNAGINNRVFYEDEVKIPEKNEIQILDMNKLAAYVTEKNKNLILNYIKQTFHELSFYDRLHIYSLYLIKQEITQVVFADLMQKGIQATKLFHDEFYIQLSNRALDSTVDMIRWLNYLLEKTFEYQKEVEKSTTLIGKINQYIHEHYNEDIGRNQIAAEFYLTPEYLAKLYKKRTGVSLKTYINQYRIEKAKELLRTSDKSISDIAEAVGFDNFSYFSTLFKNLTGLSPKDYKEK